MGRCRRQGSNVAEDESLITVNGNSDNTIDRRLLLALSQRRHQLGNTILLVVSRVLAGLGFASSKPKVGGLMTPRPSSQSLMVSVPPSVGRYSIPGPLKPKGPSDCQCVSRPAVGVLDHLASTPETPGFLPIQG